MSKSYKFDFVKRAATPKQLLFHQKTGGVAFFSLLVKNTERRQMERKERRRERTVK